ncbi:MAG TPA: TIGR02449 family protein [Gammaproteobacteria bacterium]|nr:TIGR02449 family protein [Gammaproteobacteria bacterium]
MSDNTIIVDRFRARFYSEPMESANEIIESELARLEVRIDELTTVCSRLRAQNRSLMDRLEGLTTERATLLQKNDEARTRVEAMIGRLRTLEQNV